MPGRFKSLAAAVDTATAAPKSAPGAANPGGAPQFLRLPVDSARKAAVLRPAGAQRPGDLVREGHGDVAGRERGPAEGAFHGARVKLHQLTLPRQFPDTRPCPGLEPCLSLSCPDLSDNPTPYPRNSTPTVTLLLTRPLIAGCAHRQALEEGGVKEPDWEPELRQKLADAESRRGRRGRQYGPPCRRPGTRPLFMSLQASPPTRDVPFCDSKTSAQPKRATGAPSCIE